MRKSIGEPKEGIVGISPGSINYNISLPLSDCDHLCVKQPLVKAHFQRAANHVNIQK